MVDADDLARAVETARKSALARLSRAGAAAVVSGLAADLDRAVARRIDQVRLRLLRPIRRRRQDEALRTQLAVLDVMRSRVPADVVSDIDAQRVGVAWLIGERRTRAD